MEIPGYDRWKLAYPPEWDREPEDPEDDTQEPEDQESPA